MTITTRAGKGSPLTNAEMDANWADLIAADAAHAGNTSNPHSVTKTQVGLANVDNTSDVNKPVSTATQTALDGKLNLSLVTTKGDMAVASASATMIRFAAGSLGQILVSDSTEASGLKWVTGQKSHVGLGNVDNTSDINKPISTATQTALDLKADVSHTHGLAAITAIAANTVVANLTGSSASPTATTIAAVAAAVEPLLDQGGPTALASSRDAANTDNGKALTCAASRTFTILTGVGTAGFNGASLWLTAAGTVTVVGGAGVTINGTVAGSVALSTVHQALIIQRVGTDVYSVIGGV